MWMILLFIIVCFILVLMARYTLIKLGWVCDHEWGEGTEIDAGEIYSSITRKANGNYKVYEHKCKKCLDIKIKFIKGQI